MLKPINNRKLIIFSGVLILLVICGLVIVLLNRPPEGARDEAAKRGLKGVVVGEVDIRNAFIKVAESVGPAVVSISTERTQRFKVSPYSFGREGSPFQDEFFNRFFKDFFEGLPEQYERKQMGLGSGVIIDKDGYILTNEHVVSGAEKIKVALADGRKFDGKVKGSDPKSDLAIIKIEAKNLPAAVFGNSDLVQAGEWVVAIGNPFGYIVDSPKPTITMGVVSALHRSLPSRRRGYLDLIQTDAAINPGNSGGPLCDLDGKIIGINVAIFSTTGGYQGIGFAIPINSAKAVIGDLIKGKKVAYGWMGVVIQDINEDLAKYFGLSDQKGILIVQIIKNSPAHKAGLKEGDIIRKFKGKKIGDTRSLITNVSRLSVGEEVEVSIIREGKKMTITVEIGKMPSSEEELAELQGEPIERQREIATEKWRGMEASTITEDLARRLKLRDREGVLIVKVEPGSPAYHADLRPGLVIKKVETKIINTIEDYKNKIKDLKGNVLIQTNRGFTIIKEGK